MTKTTALVIALACVASSTAVADNKVEQLLKKAKQQLAEKKYADACAAFERVDELDPVVNVKLQTSKCYEQWGKLATAYRWLADALALAKSNRDKRAGEIKKRLENLDQDVPRLTIKLPASADPKTAKVQLDDKPFPIADLGIEHRMDPGRHVIEYVANGQPRTKKVNLQKGGSTEVELPFDAAAPVSGDGGKQPPPETDPTPPAKPGEPKPGGGGTWRLYAGIGAGALGVVGLGVSGVLTLTARSAYKDALAEHCRDATDMCSLEGIRLTSNAKSRANVATVISIASAVAVGAGVVLYLTAPKKSRKTERSVYVAPAIDATGASVILGGGF